jgi:hypothetical protein
LELYIFWVYKPHVEKYCNRTHLSSFLTAVNMLTSFIEIVYICF